MTEPEFRLDDEQRRIVEQTIADHCRIRKWYLHIVNARTNHIHVVVTASGRTPDDVMDQFKSWCTRKLKEQARRALAIGETMRENWWTQNGSKRQLFADEALAAAIVYVRDCQD
jgi:REP element-mobilizing transposase RayT